MDRGVGPAWTGSDAGGGHTQAWPTGAPGQPCLPPSSCYPLPTPSPRADVAVGAAYLSGSQGTTGSRCWFSETQKLGEDQLDPGPRVLPGGPGPTSLSVSRKSLGYTSCGDTEHLVPSAGQRVQCWSCRSVSLVPLLLLWALLSMRPPYPSLVLATTPGPAPHSLLIPLTRTAGCGWTSPLLLSPRFVPTASEGGFESPPVVSFFL